MRFVVIAFAILVLAACGPRVSHDAAETFAPRSYQTYRIAATDAVRAQYPTHYTDLVDERVREALAAELAEIGYRMATADEAVGLEVVIRVQTRTRLRSGGGSGVGFGIGIGGGHHHHHGGVGVGVGTGSRSAEEEILVDLVVELRDATEGTLLWQGVAENGLSEYRRRNRAEVREVVDALFDQPPFDRLQP